MMRRLFSEAARLANVSMIVAEKENNNIPPPVFKTPAPDGAYRDEITIEIMFINGNEFTGTITIYFI